MKRFKNILYVADANQPEHESNVTEKVINLAQLNGAKVTVAGIVDEPLLDHFARLFSKRFEDVKIQLEEEKRKVVQAILTAEQWDDLEVEGLLLHGKDFISVTQKVLQAGHDLVIKCRSSVEETDSLAMRLFRKCPCPVWIIDGRKRADLIKVLGAVDLGAESGEGHLLNKKIIELTSSLAQREKGEAHYLHAWELPHEATLRGPRFNLSENELGEMKRELLTGLEDKMTTLLADSGISADPGQVHLIEGEISRVIEYSMSSLGIDVLIMGSIARSGLPGLLMGNSAEKVLSSVKSSVLAVKPDGFTSPITV